ncbi:serpin family protein [Vallitalea pronyensis]|uniref:Serpin family protein n=1 Tax=Vallitalea pronyensis TaxID=1348613 RepID=A0A8J8SFC3_9FIRM|nr:serpin family protein [Vallitalea pronyensis]QUI21207.1 serpin family protein [Vallitalea pronyensis]
MKKYLSILLCVFLSVNLTSCIGNQKTSINNNEKGLVAKALYPNSVAFDDFDANKKIRADNEVSMDYIEAIQDFTYHSTSSIFHTNNHHENMVYSPLSLYMALALSASGSRGQTQTEFLSAMYIDKLSIQELQRESGNLHRLLYTDNTIGKLWLANALWLDQDIVFKEDYINNALEHYYASTYSVDFSEEETSKLMSDWVFENTRGTLNVTLPIKSNQLMSIINTLYFYDEWQSKFDEDKTKEDVFYCLDGTEVTCDFMNKTYASHRFIEGDGYTSASLNFKNSASMTFYLPDHGIDIYDLVSTKDKIASLLSIDSSSKVVKNGEVIFQVPTFSFGSTLPLKETLISMGLEKAFESDADFSNITDDMAFISDVLQSTHIAINEKGCEASAYTQIDYCGSALPKDKAEMILDRPFLFTITSQMGVVLFIGIVNNPLL